VVQEHLEELGFLSLQRRKLLFDEDVTVRALARHDARIAAHWAGLEVAPEDSVPLATAKLADAGSAWDVMACVRTWVQLGDPKPDELFDAMAAADAAIVPGWREAFRSMPREVVAAKLPPLDAASSSPEVESILADAFAWHALLSSRQIAGAARSPHAGVRRAVARHAPHLGAGAGAADSIAALRDDPDPQVRRAAFWSAALGDLGRALEDARRLASRAEPDPFAALVVSMFGERGEASAVREPKRERDAPPPEPTLARLWRRAVRGGEDPLGLRRHVPDGFFSGTIADEAIPGE
jgi:hypothetical protein